MNYKNRKLRAVADGTGVDNEEVTETPATSEVPFLNGRRCLEVTKKLKPRGKSGETEHPGIATAISYFEVESLSAFVAALLDTFNNDEKAALEAANSALERSATQVAYDAAFGDEIKIRAMIRAFVAAGIDAAIADTMARKAFETKGL